MTRYLHWLLMAIFIFSVIEIAAFQYHLITLNSFISSSSIVLAEDDDEDDEEEGEDDDDYSETARNSSSKAETIFIPQAPVIVTTWVPVTKQIPADGYGIDTDNDGLVDALDPHPTIPEQTFFTDTDKDSIPDSDDQFPEHNDFFSFPDSDDANMNGIIDSFEILYSPLSLQ